MDKHLAAWQVAEFTLGRLGLRTWRSGDRAAASGPVPGVAARLRLTRAFVVGGSERPEFRRDGRRRPDSQPQ